jgi:hypothetical protein
MFLDLNQIETIQLDHTSRCNLACPQCARTHGSQNNDKLNPYMPLGEDLTLDDYKMILDPFEENKLTIYHCGNFGDALASPTFDETMDYCIQKNVKQFKIATNASLRTPDWWHDLAKRTNGRIRVNFSIDGLEDTNHLYRIGSNWDKIMKNAEAYIKGGGIARWYFIEFKHNYHQIEQARELASKMGFDQFVVKYTSRFAETKTTAVSTKKGHVVEDTANNQNQKDMQSIQQQYSSFEEYISKTPITCKYKHQRTVFIDMVARLWPCTWLGAPLYFQPDNVQTKSFQKFIDMYGDDFNDMRKHGWKTLEHEFFTKYLDKSWNAQDNDFQRIYTCGRTCGDKFEFSSGYGKNIKREKVNAV